MFTKFLRNIHKILGLPLSILFFLWFASGIVMIYHSFPRASQEKRIANLQPLPDMLPNLNLLSETLSDSAQRQKRAEQDICRLARPDETIRYKRDRNDCLSMVYGICPTGGYCL